MSTKYLGEQFDIHGGGMGTSILFTSIAIGMILAVSRTNAPAANTPPTDD